MASRFKVGWIRFLPFIGYHHFLMIFLMVAITCSSVLIAGCTTTGLSNVYLLSLKYVQPGNLPSSSSKPDGALSNPNITTTFSDLVSSMDEPGLQVRAGYLGLCIRQLKGDWICSTSATSLAEIFKTASTAGASTQSSGGDALNLIWMAGKFRREIVFNGLIFTSVPLAFLGILLLATFPGWHEESGDDNGSDRDVKPFPSRPVSQICLAIVALSAILLFVSVFWQHIAAAAASTMAETLSYGTIDGRVGPTAMALGWIGFGFTAIAMVGLLILILSIRVLADAFADGETVTSTSLAS